MDKITPQMLDPTAKPAPPRSYMMGEGSDKRIPRGRKVMNVKPLSLKEFVDEFIGYDEDTPPGTVKIQKLIYAIDKHAVSGIPLGTFDHSQRSIDKMGYYHVEWSPNNPYKERPIWVRTE